MMNRVLFVVIISLVLLNACSAPAKPETITPFAQETVEAMETEIAPRTDMAQPSIVIVDALGREVTFSKVPSRIVITGKGLIQILDAAYMFPEAPERIVALGKATQGTGNFISLIDPGYGSKKLLENDASAEQIAAVQPDLVILKSYLAETVGKPIETLNIPVVYVDFETPEQYTRDLAILGKVFQNESRAQELVDFYQNKVNFIQEALKDVKEKPSVLMLYHNDKDGAVAFSVPPMTWIQTQMVELAGGMPVWGSANPGKGWTVVTLEQIAAWNADQIFIIAYQKDSSEITASLKNDPQWSALRAVKEGHLYGFPADLYSWDQPDSRWILGLSWLAARLHPDRFPQFDIVAEAQQFYQRLYGLDVQFFESRIKPTFRGDLP
ncbi:ABC transporter substrate-binding protein [Anaerolinea thermophila]|uniref:ABC transporter substrate-binding protein n=1 Tax=Anaerolinea thermophila TaxID=167964 RepID=UPI0026F07DDD|nr:ABC transporter substrate-binding protein [Anaerolinea thermophila]